MSKRLYTRTVVPGLAGDKPFTPEEHAQEYRTEWEEHFRSREALLRWYLELDAKKLAAAGFAIDLCHRIHAESIVSFGAGPAVIEYVISLALPAGGMMLATDFNPWLVQRTGELFPSVRTAAFDLYVDDPADLIQNTGRRMDVAIFLGSSYVMEDERFAALFRRLGEIGIRRVVDFQSGYLAPVGWARAQAARLIGRRPPADAKFHGFARTRGELRRIYRASGLRLENELSVGPYRYAAVLATQT